jgi:hypothetical protein
LPNRLFQRYDRGRCNAVELRMTADNGNFLFNNMNEYRR